MAGRAIWAILMVILLSSAALADDTLATLAAGGLVPQKSTEISMESEDLQISTHGITVRYAFRNNTDHDIEGIVAFPLPDLDGGDVYYEPMTLPNAADLNFVGFHVLAGGKPIATSVESRAFLDRRDVTAQLRAAGLPVSVLLEPLNSAVLKLTPAQRKQLEREQLIVAGDFNPPLHSAGGHGWWAAWTMRIRFYWTQRFPAHQTVELAQSYQPVVGGSYIVASNDGSSTARNYCGGPPALSEIEQIKQRHPARSADEAILWERSISFILKTANNWNGPIRNFHLTVVTDSPEDIMLTCMPGLKRVGPTHYELSRSDFHPNKDLDLMILQANKGGDSFHRP